MIILPLPPSINRIYKIRYGGRGIYKDKKAKDWEEEAGWELKRQWKKPPYKSQVYLGIVYFMKVDSDIGNRDKILEDRLQGFLYINDKQIWHKNVKKEIDKKNPRVEIEVHPLF